MHVIDAGHRHSPFEVNNLGIGADEVGDLRIGTNKYVTTIAHCNRFNPRLMLSDGENIAIT
ncbi:hypothetical protein GCM10007171_05940 [Dickeya fangzhongdai]|nr:hypothetical protein GCM10007171_05940 [Dickeya fangzhongdai]